MNIVDIIKTVHSFCIVFVAILAVVMNCFATQKHELPFGPDTHSIFVPVKDAVQRRQGVLDTFALSNNSTNLQISWEFILPEDALFTLHAKNLSFQPEKERKRFICCPLNSLSVIPSNSDKLPTFCFYNTFKTLTATEKFFLIRFLSGKPSQGVVLNYSIRKRTSPCSSTASFQCFDMRTCYTYKDVCDGKFDCQDHSDEQNCLMCRTNYTMCNNRDMRPVEHKNCFHPELHRCDGILHCPTGEDELNCRSDCQDKIQCQDKSGCYYLHQRCDDTFDCDDHSDEANCHSIKCEVLSNRTNYFSCNNGWCIKKHKVNDGRVDCDDGSDESRIGAKLFILLVVIYIIFVLLTGAVGLIWWFGMYLQCIQPKHQKPEPEKRTSFIYNYNTSPKCSKRDFASQMPELAPPPKRYLKPIRFLPPGSLNLEKAPFPLYDSTDSLSSTTSSDNEAEHTGSTCRNTKEIEVEVVVEPVVTPAVAENMPNVGIYSKIQKKPEQNSSSLRRLTISELFI